MNNEVVLYSNGCGRCAMVKAKLNAKNVKYKEINELSKIMEVAEEQEFSMLPFLSIDDEWFQGSEAIDKVEEM